MNNDASLASADHTPPLKNAVPLGLQHVLAMFAGNITVPIIIAGVVGATPEEKVFLIQVALFIAGVATLIQTVGVGPVGARLPVMQGTSFGFLPVIIPLAKTFGIKAVLGGALVCGLVQALLGLALRRIRHLFPPLVTGIIVTAIGVSLMAVGIKYAGGGVWLHDNKPELFAGPAHLFLALLVLAVTIGVNQFCRGFLGASAVLVGIVAGYLAAIPLGLVNFSAVADAAWFTVPAPFTYGMSFPIAAVVGMAFMALVTTIETVGDISAITMGGAGREAKDRELSGGILADGAGTAIAAVFGAMPNTSYSQNTGIIAFTGVMSRHVVTIGALFLIAFGLCPKLGALVAAMPSAVLGGAAIVMFGVMAAAGLKLIARAELNRRNMLIIGVCLSAGIALPLVPAFTAHMQADVAVLVSSGLVPAALLALLLNWILPERGA